MKRKFSKGVPTNGKSPPPPFFKGGRGGFAGETDIL